MKLIRAKDHVHKRIAKESKDRGMTINAYVEYLVDFHDLRHVDQLIKQLRTKHNNFDLPLTTQAQLSILRDCLDRIIQD